MSSKIWFAGLSLAAVVATTGCNKKVPECNAVVDVVNGVGTKIKAGEKAQGADAQQVMQEAEEKAAADIGKLDLTVPEVKKIAADLKKNLEASSGASKKLMAALKAADAAQMDPLSKELDTARDGVSKNIEELNKFCQGN